jgi:hypothetical protein
VVTREISEELQKATARVAVLELRVFTVALSVKTLREQINGDDDDKR